MGNRETSSKYVWSFLPQSRSFAVAYQHEDFRTSSQQMPQYAVLHHREHPTKTDHWDFMLEDNGVLLTFALPECPNRILQLTTCETLPDHRLHYLDYEGPISGDRGNVSRWDRGSFHWLTRSSDTFRGEVSGDRLCGVFEIRTQPPTTMFCYYPTAKTEN